MKCEICNKEIKDEHSYKLLNGKLKHTLCIEESAENEYLSLDQSVSKNMKNFLIKKSISIDDFNKKDEFFVIIDAVDLDTGCGGSSTGVYSYLSILDDKSMQEIITESQDLESINIETISEIYHKGKKVEFSVDLILYPEYKGVIQGYNYLSFKDTINDPRELNKAIHELCTTEANKLYNELLRSYHKKDLKEEK